MTETQIQFQIFKSVWNTFPEYRGLFYAVPNGGLRKKSEAAILKSTGVIPGIPDMQLAIQRQTFYFELKTEKGTWTDSQKIRIPQLRKNGFPVYIIRSIEQFYPIFIFIIMEQIENKFKRIEEIENVAFFGMTKDQILYEHKVFNFILEMEPQSAWLFDDLCEPESRQQFIDCVKKFILFEYDKGNGFQLTIKNEWDGFIKILLSDFPTGLADIKKAIS
jgi:hypothetical protein